MDRSSSSAQSGPKVSQIANIFQRNPIEISPEKSHFHHQQQPIHHVHSQNQKTTVTVVRTESHSTRFNNARALFEKLGESGSSLSLKMSRSGSREDNLDSGGGGGDYQLGMSPPKIRTPFPSGINTKPQNGIASKITNISRLKSRIETDSPPLDNKPEKPERKFNSRELIEKQKKWQSHFTKTKPNRPHSDPNRCDIIRTVPGTALIPGSSINNNQNQQTSNNSNNNNKSFEYDEQDSEEEEPESVMEEKPPNPPVRHSIHPPEVKPRSCANITSPVTSPPLPPIPPAKPKLPLRSPEKVNRMSDPPPPIPQSPSKVTAAIFKSVEDLPPRRKSIDFVEEPPCHNGLDQKRPSIDMVMSTTSSSPAPSASSGPSSPAHTEDEKQENESTEKLDNVGIEEEEEQHQSQPQPEEEPDEVPDDDEIVEQEDKFGE